MTKKFMKLLNPLTGEMVCKICGAKHFANLQTGGKYGRGVWQCQNNCKDNNKNLEE